MQVVIRVDASIQIGIGHVMRCLTLAEGLKEQGVNVHFICRSHPGNLIEMLESKGYGVFVLDKPKVTRPGHFKTKDHLFHANWLGVSQKQDALECHLFIEGIRPNWLIVDHYAIDKQWQMDLAQGYQKLMVIDDLADRQHQCDLLLDQTLGRHEKDYLGLVPDGCQLLLGSNYALLRSEFAQWRKLSLKHREKPELKTLLITMGGVDIDNVTGQILETLKVCELPEAIKVIVVMGHTAPHLNTIKTLASTLPYATEIMVNVNNMAEIMSTSDLVIGASGATAWERCCLGIPTIMLVLAQNQIEIATILKKEGAVCLVENGVAVDLPRILKEISLEIMQKLSDSSAQLVDGKGCARVMQSMGG